MNTIKPKKRTRAQEVQAVMRASIYEKVDTINALLTALRQINDERTFVCSHRQTAAQAVERIDRIASDAIAQVSQRRAPMKFMDGSPVPENYAKRIAGLVRDAADSDPGEANE